MDVVVTVPKKLWKEWLAEGDLPGQEWSGNMYDFWLGWNKPHIELGERVYAVACGKLRGYSPLVAINRQPLTWRGIGAPPKIMPIRYSLVRAGNAIACTIPDPIPGFRGFRYRWWKREDEVPFPNWMEP